MIYLDWAASAPPDPRAVDEARDASLRYYANPSSPHAAGREAGERLEKERARFARLIGAEPEEIVFTSGGTEASSSLLLSLLDKRRLGGIERRKIRVVTTAIEHSSVYAQARSLEGFGVSCAFVKPRQTGIVDPEEISASLDEDTVLVSVMAVNNETGAVQDVEGIAKLVGDYSARRGRRILFHTDAVQALGKILFSPRRAGVDAASFSGHKIGAPRGVGALYLAAGVNPGFLALGGGQEKGRRPGTENLPGICAFALAAEARIDRVEENLGAARALSARLIGGMREITGARIFPESRTGSDAGSFSPYIVCAGFPPLPGEVVVRIADSGGVCISTGSACSSKKKDRTRVTESMGLPRDTALSAVRVSIGPSTTVEEIDRFISVLKEEIPPLFSISRGRR